MDNQNTFTAYNTTHTFIFFSIFSPILCKFLLYLIFVHKIVRISLCFVEMNYVMEKKCKGMGGNEEKLSYKNGIIGVLVVNY